MDLKDAFSDVKGLYPEFKVCCTQCDDKRYRLGINVVKRVGHCFNCGWRISPEEFKKIISGDFEGYEKNDFESIIQEMNIFSRREIIRDSELDMPGMRMSDFFINPQNDYADIFNLSCAYLDSRGFDPKILSEKYEFMLPRTGFFSGPRLVLPVVENQKIVFYQARTLNDSIPKYLNPPKKISGAGKNNFVFNLDGVDSSKEIIICEGIFSAISAGSQAIAVFGKEISQTQRLKIIQKGITRAVILFDPGAYNWARKAGRLLRDALDVRIANLEYGDPNEVDRDYLEEVLSEAVDLEYE